MKFTWNRVFHCEGSKNDIRLLDTLGWMSKDRWFFPNKAIVCDVIWFLFLDPPRKLIDTSNCILLISVMRIVMLLLNPFWINSNLEARPHRVYLHGRPHLNLLFISVLSLSWKKPLMQHRNKSTKNSQTFQS